MFPVVIQTADLNISQRPNQIPEACLTMHQRWMYRKLRAWLVAVEIIPDRRHTEFKVHMEFQRQFGTHMCTRQCLLFGEGIFVSNKKWCYNKCVSDTTMLLESKVEGLCVAVIQTVHRKAACPLAASLPRGPLSDAAPRCHYHHNDYSTDWDIKIYCSVGKSSSF